MKIFERIILKIAMLIGVDDILVESGFADHPDSTQQQQSNSIIQVKQEIEVISRQAEGSIGGGSRI